MRDQKQRRGPDQFPGDDANAAVLRGEVDAQIYSFRAPRHGIPARPAASGRWPRAPGRAPARRCLPARSAPGPFAVAARSNAGRPRPRSARRSCRSRRGRRSRPASAARRGVTLAQQPLAKLIRSSARISARALDCAIGRAKARRPRHRVLPELVDLLVEADVLRALRLRHAKASATNRPANPILVRAAPAGQDRGMLVVARLRRTCGSPTIRRVRRAVRASPRLARRQRQVWAASG